MVPITNYYKKFNARMPGQISAIPIISQVDSDSNLKTKIKIKRSITIIKIFKIMESNMIRINKMADIIITVNR
jgi:hypothetical protein